MYDSVKALIKGIKTDFAAGIAGKQESAVSGWIHTIKSNSDKEDYLIMDAIGAIQEFVDEINFKDFKDFDYTIKNKEWFNGTRVNRFKLEDSKATVGNTLQLWINTLVDKWANFPDKLLNDLLTTNGNAFDGTAFFANTRPNIQGSNAIDNLHTGTGTTLAQLDADLGSAITLLDNMKDRNGDPINPNSRIALYIPTQLKQKIEQLRQDQTVDLGSGPITNQYQGTFEIVVNQYQSTSNNDWYVVNLNNSFRPFIYQTRQMPDFKNDDPRLIKTKHIDFWAEARMNMGYGNPMAMVKVDN